MITPGPDEPSPSPNRPPLRASAVTAALGQRRRAPAERVGDARGQLDPARPHGDRGEDAERIEAVCLRDPDPVIAELIRVDGEVEAEAEIFALGKQTPIFTSRLHITPSADRLGRGLARGRSRYADQAPGPRLEIPRL